MNVLHLHDQIINKGGTEVYLADLDTYLPQYGCKSTWMAIQKNGNQFQVAEYRQDWKIMDRESLKSFLLSWFRQNAIQLVCIHNLFEPEIVEWVVSMIPVIKFSHSPVVVCPGRDKYWRFSEKPCTVPYGIHCFWHVYSQGCSNRHPKRIWSAWNYVKGELERAKKGYKKLVVMSNYNRNLLLECGVPDNKIVVNPYFTRYINEITSSADEEILRLLFIGRVINGKGVPEMLNAVGPILKKYSHVELDIIGDGLQMEEVKRMVATMKIEEKVRFHGWQPREAIDRFLASCYLVIFPSVYPESFGIVGIESMMNGKPVVAFDVGGVSTWLKNGETGYLLPSGNTEGMRMSIEKLLVDKKIYKQISLQARANAVQNYLPAVHMERLVKIFHEAAAS